MNSIALSQVNETTEKMKLYISSPYYVAGDIFREFLKRLAIMCNICYNSYICSIIIKYTRRMSMISYIKGELKEVGTDFIVLDHHSIGFLIHVPASVVAILPAIGSELQIYTHLYVREDILDLYGFLTRDDLNVFRILLGVSGIGPKGALAILSTISADDLRFAVLAGDAKTIAKAPGIGNKTAQKMLIELKDKLKLEEVLEQKVVKEEAKTSDGRTAEIQNEAVQALVALGYSSTDALRAVRAVELTEGMTVEVLLKASLKNISL